MVLMLVLVLGGLEKMNNNVAIVPSECDNLAEFQGEVVCGACGIHLEEMTKVIKDEDTGLNEFYDFIPAYCPNCGRRFRQ